jgi:fibronectin type 3 domain-containing protein
LTSKFAFIKPTLDGKLRLGEWVDAQVQDLTEKRTLNPSSSVTMYMKNDDQTLYLAVEDSNASQSTYNRLFIGFDRDLNKTWDKTAPSNEGFLVIDDSAGVPIVQFYAVTGDYPNIASVDETRNPKGVTVRFSYEPKSLQYEVAIDLGRTLPISLSPNGIGLYVAVVSDNLNGESPPGALLYAPVTYTAVTLSKAVVSTLLGEYLADASSLLLLHMNEATGPFAVDVTGNGNNGIATGTTVQDGRFGKARNFNGVNDIILGSNLSLNFGAQDFTVEGWINTSSAGTQPIFAANNGLSATTSSLGLYVAGGATGGYVDLDVNGVLGILGSNSNGRKVNDGKWHHVAGVRSAGRAFVYVDGVLDFQKTLQNPNSSTLYAVGANGTGSFFKGLIDEIRISSKARSPNEFNLQLPPRNLTASPSGQTVNLSWQNGGGNVALMRYRVYRGLDSTNVLLMDSTANTTYQNTGLTAATKYFYRVGAVDSTGFESARSGVAIAATGAVSAPSLASPADGVTSQPTTVTLTWVASTGAISYRLQVSPNNSFTILTFDDSTIVGTSAQVKSLLNGSTYYWRVSAKTAAGNSGYSAIWSFATIVAAPSQPTLATPANGATNQPLSLNLSWNTVSGATSYRLQLDKSNTFTFLVVDDSLISSTSRLVSSLTSGTTYYWRVGAKNEGGASPFSTTYSFVTIVSALSAPTLSAPSNNATGVSSTVTVAWITVSGAATYHVQVSTNSGYSPPLVLDDSSVVSNSRQLTGLAGNATYYWRVRAKNANGNSAWPSSFTFSTAGAKAVASLGVSFPSNPTASTDYRLVSFPGTSSLTVGQVLSGAQNTDWRIFRDNGSAEPNNLTELSSSSTLSPGEGYWLVTKGRFNFSNTLTMPPLGTDGTYTMTVRNGWNIVGNPFDVAVTWSVVKSDNSSTATLWTYAGSGGYQASTTLEPFKGYYFSSTSTVLKIRYPFPSMNVALPPTPAVDWKLQIALETEGNTDAENYVGTAQMAKESLDELDQRKPPRFLDQAFLSFSLPGPNGEEQHLSSDFRPSAGEGQVWTFSVTNPKRAIGKIRMIGIESVPPGFDVVLIDEQNTIPIDFRVTSEVPLRNSTERQTFNLIVGKKDFVQAKEAQLVPKEFELSQNYPNPFNPSTTITYKVPREATVRLEIVSLLGQHLSTLAQGMHMPGTYSVTWRSFEQHSSSGTYFARLLVDGKVVKTQKMMLLK